MNILAIKLLAWLFMPARLVVICLTLAIAASAIAVAWSAHLTNKCYTRIQVVTKEHDDLAHVYEQLLLERSAYTGYSRIDKLARQQLGMVTPLAEQMQVLH